MGDEIIKVLNDIAAKFGVAINWTSDNVMPYLKDLMGRYIQYEVGCTIIDIAVCLVVVIVAVTLIMKIYKNKDLLIDSDGDEYLRFISYFVLLLTFIGFSLGVICNAEHIIECKTIPEKVVYDYIIDQLDKEVE